MTGMDFQEKVGGIIRREGSLRTPPHGEPVHMIPEDDLTQELGIEAFGAEVARCATALNLPFRLKKEDENPPLPKLS